MVTMRVWPGGSIIRAQPGDVVGRGLFAPIPVLHPKVSEAHAVLSVRAALVLLPARGRLFVGGDPVELVELRAGDEVALCRDGSARLEILEVIAPTQGVGLSLGDRPPVRLVDGACYSLIREGESWIVRSDADKAVIWQAEGSWYLEFEGTPRALELGASWFWRGDELRVVLCDGAAPWTQRTTTPGAEGSQDLQYRVTLVATASGMRVDAVRDDGRVVGSLAGRPGELLALLLASPQRQPWEPVARRVWGRGEEFDRLQDNWHANLRKVRRWLHALPGIAWLELRSYSNREIELLKLR